MLAPTLGTTTVKKKWAFLSCPQTGGKRLDSFIDNWRAITSDPGILSIVLGYKLQFIIPVTSPNQVNANLIDSEVENFLTKGVIVEIPPMREGFFSHLFLVPKKGGTSDLC